MTLKHLFSRQSRLALGANPARNIFSWGIIVLVVVVMFAFPGILPWWGWWIVLAAEFVGLTFLGRYWADQDLLRSESDVD